LWELVGEQFPLQGAVEDVDAVCPVCHVRAHVGPGAETGNAFACGLCGAELTVDASSGTPSLVAAEA
ncbi:MAG TPA: hypothetical protein VFD74_05770, partial [Thermoleophilia bacterium]|nr:hypothetical protein [Thermoleophilia bacterium]